MVGAVDIDVALVAVAARAGILAFLKSAEPENPAGYKILYRFLARVFGVMLPSRLAPLEDHAFGFIRTDFIGYGMEPGRRAE